MSKLNNGWEPEQKVNRPLNINYDDPEDTGQPEEVFEAECASVEVSKGLGMFNIRTYISSKTICQPT